MTFKFAINESGCDKACAKVNTAAANETPERPSETWAAIFALDPLKGTKMPSLINKAMTQTPKE